MFGVDRYYVFVRRFLALSFILRRLFFIICGRIFAITAFNVPLFTGDPSSGAGHAGDGRLVALEDRTLYFFGKRIKISHV